MSARIGSIMVATQRTESRPRIYAGLVSWAVIFLTDILMLYTGFAADRPRLFWVIDGLIAMAIVVVGVTLSMYLKQRLMAGVFVGIVAGLVSIFLLLVVALSQLPYS
jgi:heme O synthase-like polyprenyltransferase